jgi:hypothetical protein
MIRYHIDCTKFTRDNIVAMLEDRGYDKTSKYIFSVKYEFTSNGQVKYKIKFDENGDCQTNYVYVFIDTDGKLVCDYWKRS